jgi:hypothetical protein
MKNFLSKKIDIHDATFKKLCVNGTYTVECLHVRTSDAK